MKSTSAIDKAAKISMFVVGIILFFLIIVGFEFVDARFRAAQRDVCAPFAVMGKVRYGDKTFVVCNHTDGPIVRKLK